MYEQPKKNIWTGRTDTWPNTRFHQHVKCLDKADEHALDEGVYILGFCCDEGVRRNQGRPGAKDGPDAIRSAMTNLTTWEAIPALYDLGNVVCNSGAMEGAQTKLAEMASRIIHEDRLAIILGGGHETAWGSYLGLRQKTGADPKIGIINIDAHFDLRPVVTQAHSGTPFRQMAEWCEEKGVPFNYFVIGIQPAFNPSRLFSYAKMKNVQIVTYDQWLSMPPGQIEQQLIDFASEQDILYLSIDLDAIDAAFAPGVSAPQSPGLFPHQVITVIATLLKDSKVRLVDICECNPGADQHNKTSKLAASLIYRIIYERTTG